MNKNFIIKLEQNFAKHEIPQFIEKINKAKGWVNYGSDNLFPYYLISLIAKSARHASILKKKAMLVGGRGFVTTNLNMETMMFLANSKNDDDLETILSKVAYDLELFGGFALNIIWSKDRTKITEINYIDVSKLRVALPDPEGPANQVEGYWISDGWENIQKYPPVLYPGFSTVNTKQASQILYVKGHRAGTEYYAQPDYLPGIFWMEMEWKISEYHLASITNGFHPSFHINWPVGANMGDEEMEELVRRLKAQFGNSVNAGESFISFAEDEMKPTITPIEANASDERYIQLNDIIETGILHAHRVNNPSLFGIKTPGELGGNGADERLQSMQEFEIDYVIPQQQIIEKIFNKIARINGIKDKLIINTYTDSYKKVGDVSQVLSVISNKDITNEQKYFLLISMNYTHDLASKLSGYHDGHNLKSTPEKIKDKLPTIATDNISNKNN